MNKDFPFFLFYKCKSIVCNHLNKIPKLQYTYFTSKTIFSRSSSWKGLWQLHFMSHTEALLSNFKALHVCVNVCVFNAWIVNKVLGSNPLALWKTRHLASPSPAFLGAKRLSTISQELSVLPPSTVSILISLFSRVPIMLF